MHANQGMTGTITVTGAAIAASTTPAASPSAAPSGVIAGPNTGSGPGDGGGGGGWLPALLLAAMGALTLGTGVALARWRAGE